MSSVAGGAVDGSVASVRLALDGVVTGEEFHDALARLEKLIMDQRPVTEA